jgi:hypothetical protein
MLPRYYNQRAAFDSFEMFERILFGPAPVKEEVVPLDSSPSVENAESEQGEFINLETRSG